MVSASDSQSGDPCHLELLPYICHAAPKGMVFVLFWSENGCKKWNFWSEIGSGFKEPCGTTLSRIPGVPPPPQDGCEDIPWTWMTLFTLSMIWKTQEEEDWIFKNTQKLADRKSNQQSLSPDWQLCFLLSCFYKQTSAFMSIPPTLSAGDFSHVLSGWVRSLLLNCHMRQKTSGIQSTSPSICHNRFLYLLLNNFFRDLQRPWLRFRWLIFWRCSTIWTDCEGISNLLYFL